MSNRVNIKRSKSEWWKLRATFHDPDDELLNIAGALAIVWNVSRTANGTAILSATLDNGRIAIIDGPAGRADITLTLEDHSPIDPGAYYHECSVTLQSGEVTAQFHGSFTAEPTIAS